MLLCVFYCMINCMLSDTYVIIKLYNMIYEMYYVKCNMLNCIHVASSLYQL